MNFQQAVQLLEQGKQITYSGIITGPLYMAPNGIIQAVQTQSIVTLTIDDYNRTDWEEFDEKQITNEVQDFVYGKISPLIKEIHSFIDVTSSKYSIDKQHIINEIKDTLDDDLSYDNLTNPLS